MGPGVLRAELGKGSFLLSASRCLRSHPGSGLNMQLVHIPLTSHLLWEWGNADGAPGLLTWPRGGDSWVKVRAGMSTIAGRGGPRTRSLLQVPMAMMVTNPQTAWDPSRRRCCAHGPWCPFVGPGIASAAGPLLALQPLPPWCSRCLLEWPFHGRRAVPGPGGGAQQRPHPSGSPSGAPSAPKQYLWVAPHNPDWGQEEGPCRVCMEQG